MTTETDPRHIRFDKTTAKPGPYRGIFPEIYRGFCWLWLKILRWEVQGNWPDEQKMVIIAAPHTSNWDGLHMLATAGYYRIKLRWIGKKSLTTGPFGGIVKWLGCVPVDRSSPHDVVSQMRDAFDQSETMCLAIPPEGTRGKAAGWKSGFYHIANTANVPLVMAVLDYGTRTVTLSGLFDPTGDYDADFETIKTHYEHAKGKYGDNFVVKKK